MLQILRQDKRGKVILKPEDGVENERFRWMDRLTMAERDGLEEEGGRI